jgi:transposase
MMFEVIKAIRLMPRNNNLIAIVNMWHKINQLSRENLTQQQIASLLGINRATVSRYQKMSESQFNELLSRETKRYACKLDSYRDFIVEDLRRAPFLSSAQVLDHLKEHFTDFPKVSERTVYNYVMRVRDEEDIPKKSEYVRQMHKIPDCEYGEQAQVDYGERWQFTAEHRRVKVYFFVMVLCRSRYKFVYFRNTPFTAKSTVWAHHLAFKFFGGMPKQVLYDQDKKMLVDENYGDYNMTSEFAKYVKEAGFEVVFMMPLDPQSKGKVENGVGYVKKNFLPGRIYINISCLNEQGIGWLARTGNGTVNNTTKLIPAEVFEEERKHLLPYNVSMEEPEKEAKPYAVRSDNTILYRGNTYDLPTGTYKGKGTKVLLTLNADDNMFTISDMETGDQLVTYEVCQLKGQHKTQKGIITRKSNDELESEKILREHLGQWNEDSTLSVYLRRLKENRPRYYRKSVVKMASLLTDYDKDTATALVEIYNEKGVMNANEMEDIAKDLCNRMESESAPKAHPCPQGLEQKDITPEKRSVTDYLDIINGKEADHEEQD